MEIKIIEICENDTLIFKFNEKEFSIRDLNECSENLQQIIGCRIITLDNQCDLVAILKNKD